MIFDKVCKLAERNAPEYAQDVLARAVLFDLREQSLPQINDQDVIEGFFTPFPVVSIEINNWLNVLVNVDEQHEPGLCNTESVNISCCCQWGPEVQDIRYLIVHGTLARLDMEGNTMFPLLRDDAVIMHVDRRCRPVKYGDFKTIAAAYRQEKPDAKSLEDITAGWIRYALAALHLINSPKMWVLKSVPNEKLVRQAAKGRKIPRSHARARYILISDKDREKHFSVEGQTSRATLKTGHPRRAHWRRLSKDKMTRVRACWVGPEETSIEGVRYRVQLDL